MSFLDTNILVYEWDTRDESKKAKARDLVKRLGQRGTISSQVVQEFAWTARRKLGLTVEETTRVLDNYGIFRYVALDMRHVKSAISTAESNRISFWDALIVEAAAESRSKVLYTEDLSHGQIIRGVRIVNPFLA